MPVRGSILPHIDGQPETGSPADPPARAIQRRQLIGRYTCAPDSTNSDDFVAMP
jgi:hypothetical protein